VSVSTDVFHPEIKRRPGWQKALPWIAGVVAVGGLIAVGIIWSNTGTSSATPLTNRPAVDVSKVPPTVKLTPGAARGARQLIKNAVARRNHDPANRIVTEEKPPGQTRK
jgi:hypothetical protein